LRHRAAALRQLAADLERQPALQLVDDDQPTEDPRERLRAALLARSAHQLHEAADGLRDEAMQLARRADELDTARRTRTR
jgi:hypothetical protein